MNSTLQYTQASVTTLTNAPRDLFEEIVIASQTNRKVATDLVNNLIQEALRGTMTFSKNVTKSINAGIQAIDEAISKQLAAVMHHPDFQRLEGSWRGLHHLVTNSETGAKLKIKMLNVDKQTLFNDLDQAVEFDQSKMFRKVYENEFGTPGGEPYGALIGDYEFTHHPEDVELLSKMSNVAAASFCPFIAAAPPALLGLERWPELAKPRDLAKIFETPDYIKWRSYRDSEDSRFVTLVMPRVLSRLPYGASTKKITEFNFEEVELGGNGKAKPVPHEHYAWMNAAYVLGTRLTDSFARTGFCVAIRGAEGGGKVEGLPAHIFQAMDGDMDLMCPTEISIPDRREKELSDCGLLPLCHYKNTDYSVFFGAQTTQKPKNYSGPDAANATANAAISARLPCMMAVSRIAHYLKVMARDWIGKFMEPEECEVALNRWIKDVTNANENASQEMKAKFPLREARIEVTADPARPGSYTAVARLRPWLQMEELNASLRMVTRIPAQK